MPRSTVTVRIHRPAAVVFDAIARHCWTNDPAWEPEVLAVKPLDGNGLRIGGRAVMTRREAGKVLDTTFEITALEPGRHVALRHIDGPMRFALDWVVVPVAGNEADVTVSVDITLLGAMRLLTPLFALMSPGRNARISGQMVAAIEAMTPASERTALAPA
jgi:hypothetical protein